jgi:prepilin peptidase CpaA
MVAVVLLIASVTDLREARIPNWLTFSCMAGGLILSTILDGEAGVWLSLTGLALGFLLLVPIYAMQGVAAGDVKLLMAVGALMGPRFVFQIFLVASLIGAVFALVVVFRRGHLRETVKAVLAWPLTAVFSRRASGDLSRRQSVDMLRYAVVLAVATVIVQIWRSLQGGL